VATLSSKQTFTFYTSHEYWQELIRQITMTKAGDHIDLVTMDFDPRNPIIATITTSLQAAAGRGVAITLVVDAHTFLIDVKTKLPGPLWYHSNFKKIGKRFAAKYETLMALATTPNITYVLTNRPARPFSSPFAGRSHIKFSCINNHVFIGGCNMSDTTAYDLMVGFDDEHIASFLRQLLVAVGTSGNSRQAIGGRDQTTPVNAETSLLLDAGVRNQSLIFERALAMIDEAQEEITITCQFFPNSLTAQHLTQAYHRGVATTIIYADPRSHTSIGSLGQQVSVLRERLRVPKKLFQKRLPLDGPMMHAKLLATDKGTILGSHNFVRAGVYLGTAEIALLSSSKDFHDGALAALQRQLAGIASSSNL
jgi:phosphatidylserine/phosphatidylglycerophosphate/cardiolipin synthase-like enzyme